jgi:guanylate kinase
MSTLARRGLCLVISAPSGAGKTSLTRALLAAEPNLALSVSVTTRAPRPGEQEGVHYFFRTQNQFTAMAKAGELLEQAVVFGHCYGTPRTAVESALAAGRDMMFDIDWQGHRQLRAALGGDVVGVFILPPSLAALKARLRGRGTDDEAEIARRMQAARDEMVHAVEFDHVLINADFDLALAGCRAVLQAARSATHRLSGLPGLLAELGA